MKRNFILTIAVAILMVASTVAQAADVSFSGQIRPRMTLDSDATDTTTSDTLIMDTRVRLNAKATANANTSVFLQLQSVGNWGVANADTSGTRVSQGGAGTQASDALNDVGFHQAYLTLKNFYGTGFDAKIGRQEVVLDGHRLFGNTGWTTGAETKDAIRLTHAGGNHTINAIYIAGRNEDSLNDMTDRSENQYVLHANTQGVLGGNLSGYFVYTNDGSAITGIEDNMHWYTVGARQKGKLAGLDYRVEFYHQFGDGGAAANAIAGLSPTIGDGSDIDRDAQMFGIRLGKTFKNTTWSPTVTLWYDYLSGSDDESITDLEHNTFDTLSDTGHKFYGFQDFYLNSQNQGTRGLGLQDIAIKTKMSPKAGWTLKADLHWFHTAIDGSGADADTFITNDTLIQGDIESDLGSELDLTLVHKYDSNTKVVLGYSHYWTSVSFAQLNTAGDGDATLATATASTKNDDSEWAYVMIDTKF